MCPRSQQEYRTFDDSSAMMVPDGQFLCRVLNPFQVTKSIYIFLIWIFDAFVVIACVCSLIIDRRDLTMIFFGWKVVVIVITSLFVFVIDIDAL